MNTGIEPIELTADSPRELTDTELDAVSGGAVALTAGASSGANFGAAVASAAPGISFAQSDNPGSPFFAVVSVQGPGAGISLG